MCEEPEVVVNGEVVGYGMDGMKKALFKMVPALDPSAFDAPSPEEEKRRKDLIEKEWPE